MNYEYEYGRYKKKVEDQQKELDKLKEELAGWRQILDANNAIVTAILRSVKAEKGSPILVHQADINAATRGELVPIVEVKEDEPGWFKMHYEERDGE